MTEQEKSPVSNGENTELTGSKRTQFKPGQVANPNGRPKGTKNLSTMLWEALQEKARNSNGEPMKDTYADLFIKRVLKDAIEKGSGKELIFDRIEGQAKQAINLNVETENTQGLDVMELARKVSEELKAKKTNK